MNSEPTEPTLVWTAKEWAIKGAVREKYFSENSPLPKVGDVINIDL